MFGWFRKRTPMEKVRAEIAGARRHSEWLKKRPFSDQYDGDGGGGYFAAAGGSSVGGRDEAPFVLKPIPPHPRARRTTA